MVGVIIDGLLLVFIDYPLHTFYESIGYLINSLTVNSIDIIFLLVKNTITGCPQSWETTRNTSLILNEKEAENFHEQDSKEQENGPWKKDKDDSMYQILILQVKVIINWNLLDVDHRCVVGVICLSSLHLDICQL